MSEIAEYGHFNKVEFTAKDFEEFNENIDDDYELELKRKVQKVFHDSGIEISLDEIFQ